MKALWKGSLSFGLVTIPIELYSATQAHSLGFKLLHAKCHTPINNLRWCPHCQEDVTWSDIVKGLKLKDSSYFVLTQERLKKLKLQKTDSINIVEFINKDALEPIYLDNHYYIIPQSHADHAYFLFTTALADLKKVAIGQFVLKDKEHICALQPYKNGLLLTTLNYAYEVRQFKEFNDLHAPHLPTRELTLARQLITQLSKKAFSIDHFKDTFIQKLKKALGSKKIERIIMPEPKEAKTTPSLLQALQESLKSPNAPQSRTSKRIRA